MRSFASATALSGNPTIANDEMPGETWASTVISIGLIPTKAAVFTLKTTVANQERSAHKLDLNSNGKHVRENYGHSALDYAANMVICSKASEDHVVRAAVSGIAKLDPYYI
jgi:hypothetical protein